MSSEPLADIVPIMARPQDGAVITQFDYPMCESLGLVKMDSCARCSPMSSPTSRP